MNNYKYLALPAYTAAFVLVFVPLADVTLQLLPLNFVNAQWRFGAIGLFSNAFMLPALGLLIALVTATALQHTRLLRVMGALSVLAAVATTGLLLLFLMDSFETRLSVKPAVKVTFVVASLTAAVKLTLGILGLAGVAIAGFRTNRGASAPKRATARKGLPLAPRKGAMEPAAQS